MQEFRLHSEDFVTIRIIIHEKIVKYRESSRGRKQALLALQIGGMDLGVLIGRLGLVDARHPLRWIPSIHADADATASWEFVGSSRAFAFSCSSLSGARLVTRQAGGG